MWLQYFSWQWGRDWMGGLQRGLAVVFGALGLLGAWRHWRADQRSALAMTTLMTTFTLLLIFYLNFKYGYSQRPDLAQPLHEVRERDYFFIASFALWGVWVGIDRKSTRLNSSHSQISYAVFCLKKKKIRRSHPLH